MSLSSSSSSTLTPTQIKEFSKLNFKDYFNFEKTKDVIYTDIELKNYVDIFDDKSDEKSFKYIFNFQINQYMLKIILNSKNIDFDFQDNEGSTGFMIAACQYQNDQTNLEIIKLLLESEKIDFNLKDKEGCTGFMFACQYQTNPKYLNYF